MVWVAGLGGADLPLQRLRGFGRLRELRGVFLVLRLQRPVLLAEPWFAIEIFKTKQHKAAKSRYRRGTRYVFGRSNNVYRAHCTRNLR